MWPAIQVYANIFSGEKRRCVSDEKHHLNAEIGKKISLMLCWEELYGTRNGFGHRGKREPRSAHPKTHLVTLCCFVLQSKELRSQATSGSYPMENA